MNRRRHSLVWRVLVTLFVVPAVLAGYVQQPAAAPSGQPFKVAFVPCGRITDRAWSQNGWEGMQAAKKTYNLDVAYTESPVVADVERIARSYAQRGYKLILLHCGTFSDAALGAAKDYPKVWFGVSSSKTVAKNAFTYDALQQEASFLAGALAGLMTKTNKLGIVAGVAMPALTRQPEGFKLGARYVNPKVQVMEVYINSWEDTAKAKEAALGMIDQRADVIFTATDQAAQGAFKAAEERGVYAIASYADQASFAPKTIVTSVLYNYAGLVTKMIGLAVSGKLEGRVYEGGIADGVGSLAPYRYFATIIPKTVQDKVNQIKEDIRIGRLVIPSTDQLAKPGSSDSIDPQSLKKQ